MCAVEHIYTVSMFRAGRPISTMATDTMWRALVSGATTLAAFLARVRDGAQHVTWQ